GVSGDNPMAPNTCIARSSTLVCAARTSVSAIKVVVAQLQTRVLDRAMQVFGAMGLSPDTPLSFLWTWGRAMRVLDGPDEVHLRTVARNEYRLAREHLGESTLYFPKTLR